jgi:hypothetical protein
VHPATIHLLRLVQAEKELGSKESIRSPWRVQGMHVRTTEVNMQMREDSGQDNL